MTKRGSLIGRLLTRDEFEDGQIYYTLARFREEVHPGIYLMESADPLTGEPVYSGDYLVALTDITIRYSGKLIISRRMLS